FCASALRTTLPAPWALRSPFCMRPLYHQCPPHLCGVPLYAAAATLQRLGLLHQLMGRYPRRCSGDGLLSGIADARKLPCEGHGPGDAQLELAPLPVCLCISQFCAGLCGSAGPMRKDLLPGWRDLLLVLKLMTIRGKEFGLWRTVKASTF